MIAGGPARNSPAVRAASGAKRVSRKNRNGDRLAQALAASTTMTQSDARPCQLHLIYEVTATYHRDT
ncbi:MAG TPA: hypothetical protein VGP32_05315 [Steroidobacteraceae bacterium]|jgi:hypothetical protein|nr:hypothetical protein [Steroidobacteraceae bacterium]